MEVDFVGKDKNYFQKVLLTVHWEEMRKMVINVLLGKASGSNIRVRQGGAKYIKQITWKRGGKNAV